ncbi:hypothetical protein LCGC14_2468320, partial [marine sediment metagenome]
PPRGSLLDAIDRGERFCMLDSIMMFRGGAAVDVLGRRVDGSPDLDWNVMLRTANGWYDRMVDPYRQSTPPTRRKAVAQVSQIWTSAEFEEPIRPVEMWILRAGGWPCRKARSRNLVDLLARIFLVSSEGWHVKVDDGAARNDLAKVAIALAGFRAETGRWPERLGQVSPKYLKKVPVDLYTGEALLYRVEGERCIVYSLGANGIDDDGQGGDESGRKMLDIVARLGAPATKTDD